MELDDALGRMNGTMKDGNHIYFKCADNHGALVVPAKVSLDDTMGVNIAQESKMIRVNVPRRPGQKLGIAMNAANGHPTTFPTEVERMLLTGEADSQSSGEGTTPVLERS